MKGVFKPKLKAKRLINIYGLNGAILIADTTIKSLITDRNKMVEKAGNSNFPAYRNMANRIRNWKLLLGHLNNY